MDLLASDSTSLPLFEPQLKETETAIDNLLNTIQMCVLTKSTKARLEELEVKISCEKLAKPKITAEQVTYWLHQFRKLDTTSQAQRKILIDAFVNAIFLYDDKILLTFNFKDGTKTITFDDVQTATNSENTGSDLNCFAAPNSRNPRVNSDK